MADSPSRDEINARLEASELRADIKLVRLDGKLDRLLEKADGAERRDDSIRDSIRNNALVLGLSLGALMVAIVALFPVFYDLGGKHREAISSEVKEQMSRQRPTDATPQQPPPAPAKK